MADPPEYTPPKSMVPPEQQPPQSFTSLLVDIWQDVGRLRSDVGRLDANVDHVIDRQQAADVSRAGIHQKLDITNAEVAAAKFEVEKLATTVKRIEPVVDRLDKIDLRRVAVNDWLRKTLHSWWTAVGMGAAALAWLAHEWDLVRGWLAKLLR